jgi:hypothetical protein
LISENERTVSTLLPLWIESRPLLHFASLAILVKLARQEPSDKGVEFVKADSELSQAREQLRFNVSMESIVNALIRRRFDPIVLIAQAPDVGNLPRLLIENSSVYSHRAFDLDQNPYLIVRDAETLEFAFLVEIIDSLESYFVGSFTIRSIYMSLLFNTVADSAVDISPQCEKDPRRYHISKQSVLHDLSWMSRNLRKLAGE